MWSRTLGQLVSDVTDRCDTTGFTTRHPVATVRRRIIESYHALRDLMTSAGSKRWLVGPIALTTTSAQWDHRGYCAQVPLAAGTSTMTPYERPLILLTQVDGIWTELKPIAVGEIFDFYQPSNGYGKPAAWALSGTPEATATESTDGGQFTLSIAPDFDPTAYPIQFFAVSVIDVADSDSTTLTLDGPGFEWLVWDAVTKIAARDNDTANTYAIASAERQRAESRILAGIRDERKNTIQRRDVFHGRSRFDRARRL